MSASPLRQSTVTAGPVSPRGQLPQAVHQEVRVHSLFLFYTLSLSFSLSYTLSCCVLQTDKIKDGAVEELYYGRGSV